MFGAADDKKVAGYSPDSDDTKAGKKLIIFVACCEGAVLLIAWLVGLWFYLNA